MGYFSEKNLESQSDARDVSIQSAFPTPDITPAAPPATPFASPFISSAFTAPPPVAVPSQPAPVPATSPANIQQPVVPVHVQAPVAAPTAAMPSSSAPVQQTASPAPAPAPTAVKSEDTKAEEKKDAPDDEDAKRKEHEAAEAKRKAEHEAKFAARRAQENAERERVAALTDDAVMAEAMKRVNDGFERLTRRNMKDCVSEHIQTMCLSDPAFARNAMNPVKSMTNCIKFINNKAREYVQQEMKDNDMKPDQGGIYGCDVPDDLVYQWALDYFNDPNAKEDEREDEKFTPKPYVGGRSTKSKKADKAKDKKAEKKSEKKPEPKKAEKKAADDGQISFSAFAMPETKAG